MKKNLIITTVLTAVLLTGCSWFDKAPEVAKKPVTTRGVVTDPGSIKGLKVPSCEKLFADFQSKFPKDSVDDSYQAAATVLFSGNQKDAANACCDKIKDENLKKTCKK